MQEQSLDKDYPESEHSYSNTFCQINQILVPNNAINIYDTNSQN